MSTGLTPNLPPLCFLIVRVVDVLWDPLVGTFVDKHNPKLGKRSYLVLAGVPAHGFRHPLLLERILRFVALRLFHLRGTVDALHID